MANKFMFNNRLIRCQCAKILFPLEAIGVAEHDGDGST